jgi:hypothetical protein
MNKPMNESSSALLARLGVRRTALDEESVRVAEALVAQGLAEIRTARDGRRMAQLTERGRRAKEQLRASRRRAASYEDLRALEERVVLRVAALIEARLQQLEPRLRTMPPAHKPEVLVIDIDGLGARVLSAIQEIDEAQHLDGIVPIAVLRNALPDMPAALLDQSLIELERQYRIDLKIANDPATVPSPDAGIRLAGRGLACFVAVR